jgi:hypothetical protein
MHGLVQASALLSALCLGCAAGKSDDGPSWGPPTVVDDGAVDDDDGEGEGDEGEEAETGFGTGGETMGFDDVGDSGGGEPAPAPTTGAEPPPQGDGGEPPPPPDDGGDPPPPADGGDPPPPGDLGAQCQAYCGALQACGFVADAAEAMQCAADCTVSESPACDAAWSDVMSCVTSLDCFQMQVWWVAFPGYPCQAEDEAYATC